ncbi:hypothetical protein LC593_00685 [Nostoc sp. CHAB 5844]|nr:hypothetical protein [Nostoc sp. CHAB 5844]
MPYSDFTLKKVKKDFRLTVIEPFDLLQDIQSVTPSQFLTETINKRLSLALAVNTEKARSEWLVSPILSELKDILSKEISLFSGTDFTVDPALGLSGVCDFLISRSPEQLEIEAPALVVVEAKKADLNPGIGQCIAEMVAAQMFNEMNNSPIPIIYGAITSGDRWKFLKLESQTVTIGLTEYNIPPVDKVLGILLSFVSNIS